MSQGRKRLEREIKRSLNEKQDKPKLVPALLGAYVNGQKTLTVAGRTDFVWCRIRGSTSEVVQAFNDQVGAHWDLPVLIYRDPNYEGLWKVYGRDITQYEDWEGVSYLPKHGNQHSFVGGRGAGSDPVWVYKRQFMPFLPRPVASGNMSIYIEEDLYHWDGEYHWWDGSGTADLTSYKPTGSNNGKFLTVYIEGSSKTLKILEGDEFSLIFTPNNPTEFIPVPDPNVGIPIASVILQTGTQNIGWHEIYDLRLTPSQFPQTGSNIGVYDEHAFQGGVSNFDFVGGDVSAVVSGSYAYVEVDIASVVFPEEQIGVYNTEDGEPLGTGTRLDWGDNLDVSFSGSTVRVDGQGGGGGSGSVIVLDDGSLLGSATRLDFIGDGVSPVLSGETAEITIAGGGGGGGGSGSTYVRAGEVEALDSVTGIYWRVPDQEFVTGSLSVAINGVWQTPVTEYTEQHAPSGTFVLDESPPTGSIVSAIWGMPAGGGGGETPDIYESGGLVLADAEEIDFVGDGVDITVSGSRARVEVSGGGGGGDPVSVATGTFAQREIIYDETLGATGEFSTVTGSFSDYDMLEIFVMARGSDSATVEELNIYFNGDSTDANYRRAADGGGSATPGGTLDRPQFALIPAATADSDHWGTVQAVIHNPGDSRTQAVDVQNGWRESSTAIRTFEAHVHWETAAALTQIEVLARNAQLIAGSRMIVYGVRSRQVVTSVSGGGGGGGGGETPDIYEDGGLVLADAEEIDFVGDIDVSASGTRAQVKSGGAWSMRKSSSQTLTTSQYDEITFDTEVMASEGSVVDLANNRFVAPADGYYFATVNWVWEGTAPGANHITRVLVNGSELPPLIRGSTQDKFDSREATVPLQLSEGDHVTLEMNPGTTSSVTARGSASSQLATHFSLVRVA